MIRFEKVKNDLIKLYEEGAELEGEVSHALNTMKWVCELAGSPSELLKIAALGHDIDRVIRPREMQGENESYDDYKKRHSERSARLISEFLSNYDYTESEINQVYELVRLHEVGGSTEADILQDADSISYFDNNLEIYAKRNGPEKTSMKIAWMYDRCSSRAQKIINNLPMYIKFKDGNAV